VSTYDDFVERLGAALEGEEGRESFIEYLQGMTREERTELLAEAERRDPEGAAELARAVLDQPDEGGPRRPRKGRSEKASKQASKKGSMK
jgi:hypothetical protein